MLCCSQLVCKLLDSLPALLYLRQKNGSAAGPSVSSQRFFTRFSAKVTPLDEVLSEDRRREEQDCVRALCGCRPRDANGGLAVFQPSPCSSWPKSSYIFHDDKNLESNGVKKLQRTASVSPLALAVLRRGAVQRLQIEQTPMKLSKVIELDDERCAVRPPASCTELWSPLETIDRSRTELMLCALALYISFR